VDVASGDSDGEVPEWPKGTGCKPVGSAFGGSNPPLSTIKVRRDGICRYRLLLQVFEGGNSSVVERQPSKLRVAGSNPVSRSIIEDRGRKIERLLFCESFGPGLAKPM
jgi:hypothetical protein